MKNITAILNKILEIAKDAKVWLRVLVFIIALFTGAIMFSKTKTKKEDCTYYIEQNKQLVGALIDIKKELQPAEEQPISFMGVDASPFVFASFIDTTPTQRKQIQQKQQQQVQKVVGKIDSILFKIKVQEIVQKTKT